MSDNDGYDADVRAWLAGVEVPPSRVDVGSLARAARGRARRRQGVTVAGTALAVAASVAVAPAVVQMWPADAEIPAARSTSAAPTAATSTSPGSAATPLRCDAAVLTVPDGLAQRGVRDPAAVRIVAMDPGGRFVVGDTYGDRNNSPAVVLWDHGAPLVLPIDAHHVTAHAVNSRGEVVGSGAWEPLDSDSFGWVYRDGEVTILPLPDGYQRVVLGLDINETGDVVGNVQDREYHGRAVVWPSPGAERPYRLPGLGDDPPAAAEAAYLLPEPGSGSVSAEAITDDGVVVGWFAGSTAGYAWYPDRAPRELPLPAGADRAVVTAASGHWAVGYASFAATEEAFEARVPPDLRDDERLAGATLPVPVRWNLSDGTAVRVSGYVDNGTVLLNASGFGARAVNATGDVVVGYPQPQVLRMDGRTVELPVPVGLLRPDRDIAVDPVAVSGAGDLIAGNVVADTWGESPIDGDADELGTPDADTSGLPAPVTWQC